MILPKILETSVNLVYKNGLKHQRDIRLLPLQEIEKIQWKRLQNLLNFVYKNNTFYKNYFDSVHLKPDDINQPEDLLLLPITEKQNYRKHFNAIITKGVNPSDHVFSCTSGSSGEPFQFYNEKKMVKKTLDFSYILNKESMGIKPYHKLNELEIKPSPLNVVDIKTIQKPRMGFKDRFKNRFLSEIIGLRSDDIQPDFIDKIVRLIQKNNIQGIYGYSASVLLLAEYMNKTNDTLHLTYVICMGEGLLKQQKQIISDTFHCPIYMDYGSSECPRMGFECAKHNGYHMDIYNYYFEYLKDGKLEKDGESGEIIVTNLNNYIFPFIRYKIGDLAEQTAQQCDCGIHLPLVKNIQGRISSSIVTPQGKEIPNGFFAAYFEYLFDDILQYQVIQTEKDAILIKIVPARTINEELIEQIHEWIETKTENAMKITITITDKIPPARSGKKLDMITYEQYQKMKQI